jgi:5'-nucleotidase
MSTSPKRLAVLASAAVVAAGLTVLTPPALANPGGTGLVINEAYLNGGSAGATYTNRYVELYNPTGSAISLSTYSLQYRAAGSTGNSTTVVPLTGSIASHGYWTLVGGSNGANGVAVPGGDQTATGFNASGSAGGTITLASVTTPVDPSSPTNIVDKLGYGTSNAPETTAAGTGYNVTTSLGRNAASADTDSNLADFTPQGNLTPDAVNQVNPTPFTGSIAEIQGNGVNATKNGFLATTTGVVTSRYTTGGFDGFYMQTAGSGGASDPTPDASDAIFVYVGSSKLGQIPAVGNTANVVGLVKEFNGLTEIDINTAGGSLADGGAATPIDPHTGALPGTDCALPGNTCLTGAALAAAQEAHEGELWDASGDFTVTDAFDGSAFGGDAWGTSSSSSMFGEVGLAANSTEPLVAPTEEIDAQDHAAVDTRTAYNKAHQLVLDDASSITFWNTAGTGQDDVPFPYYTPTNPIRVGSSVAFNDPMIYSDSFGTRRLIPLQQVTDDGSSAGVDFTNTRPTGAAAVGGDIKLATFNVLNFFPVSAAEYVALNPATNACSAFLDRDDNPIAVNSCTPNGPRGAWDDTNLRRQRSKIVKSINALNADVVSLEELENSVQFGRSRDDAISKLVAALNTDAGSTRWAYVPSPAAADLPPLAEQDVIRTGFIYNPAKVIPVGASKVLVGNADFNNAREPLAQAFKVRGTGDANAFGVIVNHFKSKGSGTPDPDGQGNANADRVKQANGLLDFATQFKTDRGIARMFLVGDFNAYSEEDPVQEIEQGADNVAGNSDDYHAVEEGPGGDESYSFSGLSGSLDHIFANDAAYADVTGADVVDINASEFVFNQYSRFNYNVTQLFNRNTIYASSDHNPEIVGINKPNNGIEIQILGTNDFHGRIANDPASASAGAAVMAGAVKQLRADNPNTVFAAAGDLIGASTFESFIDKDKPTIDALNSAGLEVSSVGNHEFDQGYDDLVNRVMAPYDATTNPKGGANWEYLAANLVKKGTNDPVDEIAPTWTKTMNGVKVGFVGAVTEHLPELVSPAGIADIDVTDIVTAVNTQADELKNVENADIVIMLVHEGAGGTDCATMDDDPSSDFGSIINGIDENVDAIVSGHTHLEYNCDFTVQDWVDEGRKVTKRPVVSAGQYGAALNQIVFDVNPGTGEVISKRQNVLRLKVANGGPFNYPVDAPTQTIVDAAVANASVLGAVPLGQIGGPFGRARFIDGSENRGGESTLGNLVAEVQRWATENPESGSAQIAFMNPGGLRQDMLGTGTGAFPRTLTFKQAADVQPFANTLVNMKLTGAQIKSVLEEQWQPAGASRPFLRLGASKGFTYTYDPSKPAGSRITGMWLNGTPIQSGTSYSVTANSFLASGGDNFLTFAQGTQKRDTGKVDLQAMVDYMAEFANPGAGDPPLPISYAQQAVGVKFPGAAPASYAVGDHVTFDLTSLVMTENNAVRDTQVSVKLGGTTLGTFPVATVLSPPGNASSNDEVGTASVDVVIPAGTAPGATQLVVEGASGTSAIVPVTVSGGTTPPPPPPPAPTPAPTTVAGAVKAFPYGEAGLLTIAVSRSDANGSADVFDESGAKIGTATISAGVGSLTLAAKSMLPGTHTLTVKYLGTNEFAPSQSTVTFKVRKATPTVKLKVADEVSKAGGDKVVVRVTAANGVPVTGKVKLTIKGTGKEITVKLVKGKATFTLPKVSTAGTYTLKARYLGSSLLNKVADRQKVDFVK